MTARTWTDQPAVCEQAAVLWSLHVPDVGIVEIRGMPAPEDPKLHNREYLVSVGNLFGQQTVRCYGEDKLFELLRATSLKGKNGVTLPTGCELLAAEAQAS